MTADRTTWRNRASSLTALALSLIISLVIFALAPLLLDQDVRDSPTVHAPYLMRMPAKTVEKQPRSEPVDKPTETQDMPMPMPELALAPPDEAVLDPPLPALPKMVAPAMPTAPIDLPPMAARLPEPEKSALAAMPATPKSHLPPEPAIPAGISAAGTDGQVYRLDQVDTRPGAIQRMQPAYPRHARRRRIEGWVKIAFLIDRYGLVKNLQIMESSPPGVFDNTVMDTVSLWRFQPAKKADQTVDVQAQTTIEFKLN
jgi:protein TonB